MINDIKSVLYSEETLHETVAALGKKISEDYRGRNLLLVSVLKGSVVFMTDLMRCITIPCEIDFMAVSSYGSGVKSSGTVRILKDLDRDIRGYDVLVVEDILDSGKTLNYLWTCSMPVTPTVSASALCLTSLSAERWISTPTTAA